MRLSKYSGYYLFATGVIHNLIGFIMGWGVLTDIHHDGWWNSVESSQGVHFDRSAILWFLLLGFFWMLMGYLMQLWLNQKQLIPASIGCTFVILGLLTGILVPVSGAWLFIPQGLVIVLDSFNISPEEVRT